MKKRLYIKHLFLKDRCECDFNFIPSIINKYNQKKLLFIKNRMS